jgi:hypothetical protein
VGSKNYSWKIPLTSTSGKIRIKERTMIEHYGYPVATRQTAFNQNHYVEWQIGYDALIGDVKKIALTALSKFTFIGANAKRKALYELSEILYHCIKNNILTKQQLIGIKNKALALKNLDFLDNKLKIKRSNFVKKEINGIEFEEATVEYPLLIHKFKDFDIITEIIVKEKQRAVGIMPMLYLCFPITKLQSKTLLLGRKAQANEKADLIIDSSNADVFLELLFQFAMLSASHNHDIVEIINVIENNI